MNETLEQIALRVALSHFDNYEDDGKTLMIAGFDVTDQVMRTVKGVVAEIGKQQEPTCVVTKTGIITNVTDRPLEPGLKLFTSPQPTPEEVKDAVRYRQIIEQLWDIIDDIDTYGDMAKSDDKLFRSLVENRQKDRWKTGITTDGYELNIQAAMAAELGTQGDGK